MLELVGHVLPSALNDLALAMASACSAFSPPSSVAAAAATTTMTAPLANSGQKTDPAASSDRNGEGVFPSRGHRRADDGRRAGSPPFAPENKQMKTPGVKPADALPSRRGGDTGTPPSADKETGGTLGAGEGEGRVEAQSKGLFRAVGAVDQDTAYFNVGVGALAGRRVGGGERGVGAYCLETRARMLLPAGRVVFDVCSTDPGVTAALL